MKHTNNVSHPVSSVRFFISLGVVSLVSLLLLFSRIEFSNSARYLFMGWNLVLAIIPALLAWLLVIRVQKYGWLMWQQVILTLLWIVFLPNSFYLITDLVHLRPNYEASIFFDISLLSSFVFLGLVYGYISVFLVHNQLMRRMAPRFAYLCIALLFLLVSFAVFLGRYTRWNTWDILLRPAGLLFDVSDRFINPAMHVQTYLATGVLFVVIFSLYSFIYEAIRLIRQS